MYHQKVFLLFFIQILTAASLFSQDQQHQPQVALEFMPPDSVFLMGTIPFSTTTHLIETVLGTADSTRVLTDGEMCTHTFYGSCRDYHVSFFKGAQFETCKTKAVLEIIRFEPGTDLFLEFRNRFHFSAETTVNDLIKIFPIATQKISPLSVYQEGGYDVITVRDKMIRAENAWMFFFRDGQLRRIDYWSPC